MRFVVAALCMVGAGAARGEAVLTVSAEGLIGQLDFAREDDLARCLWPKLVGAQGPRPPFAPIHLFLDMKITP